MKSYTVVLISKDNISPQIKLMGVSAYKRCAEKCAKYFETDRIFVPALTQEDSVGNVSILNRYPEENEIEHNLVVIDSALVFEGKLLWRMRNRFDPPLAAYSEDLKPLGFAILDKTHYSEAFFDNPWSNIDKIVENNLSARVIVIDTHFFRINSQDDIKDAETFLLRSLKRKSDGIIAENINRPVSIKITKFLTPWKINPNSITSVSLVIGLIGSLQFLRNSYQAWLIGMILLQISSILSGVDGETAKLTLRRTELGKWYNAIANDVIMISFLGGLARSVRHSDILYESGILFLLIYLIYILSNYAFKLVSSLKKGNFFIQELADRDQSKKSSYTFFLSLFKRDIIIFSGLGFSILGILEFFPPIYLALPLILIVLGLFKYFTRFYKGGAN